jgi:hypothetical protein
VDDHLHIEFGDAHDDDARQQAGLEQVHGHSRAMSNGPMMTISSTV